MAMNNDNEKPSRDPRWIVGDPQQSSLFILARAGAQLALKAQNSKFLWIGNSIIFAAANFLATEPGQPLFKLAMDAQTTNFDIITTAALGISGGKAVVAFLAQRRASSQMNEPLSQMSATADQMLEAAKRVEDGVPSDASLFAIKRLKRLQESASKMDASPPKGPRP